MRPAQWGVFLGVDHNRRFGFGYRHRPQILDEGRLGQMRPLVVFQVFDRTPRPGWPGCPRSSSRPC